MKLKPLGDHIVVKPLEEMEVKKGGIIIPDTAKEKPSKGEVIAVGAGKTLDDGKKAPMELKAGDKVIYSKYGGNEIKIDDVEYLIMTQDDVLKSERARRNAVKRTSYSGGIYWKRHNPDTLRCRCEQCMARRQESPQ